MKYRIKRERSGIYYSQFSWLGIFWFYLDIGQGRLEWAKEVIDKEKERRARPRKEIVYKE